MSEFKTRNKLAPSQITDLKHPVIDFLLLNPDPIIRLLTFYLLKLSIKLLHFQNISSFLENSLAMNVLILILSHGLICYLKL